MTSRRFQADLARYYDAEAAAGVRSSLSDLRRRLVAGHVDRLKAEGAGTVLDVGAGPGRDTEVFAAAGLRTFGLDLSHANARVLRRSGVGALVGTVLDLPIASASIEAVWSMSTLVHVADAHIDRALGEIVRVARPGASITIGSWGSRDWEGTHDFTRFDPPRFFSLRDHRRWGRMLAAHASVLQFDTYETDEPGWEYQFAVLRA